MGARTGKGLRAVLAGSLLFGGAFTASVLGNVQAVSARSTMPSITTIPIQVIQTSDGVVSYRSDGSGSPLVMIMGFWVARTLGPLAWWTPWRGITT